jgi:hypothetical protein
MFDEALIPACSRPRSVPCSTLIHRETRKLKAEMSHHAVKLGSAFAPWLLALAALGCSSSPDLGLLSTQRKEPEVEIEADAETLRVQQMQLLRGTRQEQPNGPVETFEDEVTLEDTWTWAALVCGGKQARDDYSHTILIDKNFGQLGTVMTPEAAAVELRLCMARAYAVMAETARGPLSVEVVYLVGPSEVITIPVQSGAASVALLARATEFAKFAWDMASDDLVEYVDAGTISSGDEAALGQPGVIGAPLTTVSDSAATTQARLLGPIMREAYDRYLEYHKAMVERVLAVADAELSSSTSSTLSAFRGVSRDELSRSWAAHMLVGGELGLTGMPQGTLCTSPKLTPQAERAVEIFRRAAPSAYTLDPANYPANATISNLLNDISPNADSVRARLQSLFGESIPNSVEESYQLRTEDFIEAQQYLLDENRTFSRFWGAHIPGPADAPFMRNAAIANPPPVPNPTYWAAVTRSGASSSYSETVLSNQLTRFQNDASWLMRQRDLVSGASTRRAIFGPIASIVSDLDEQVLGQFIYDNGTSPYVLATLSERVAQRLTKLRVVMGEVGLQCAVTGLIEGVECPSGWLTASSATNPAIEQIGNGNVGAFFAPLGYIGADRPARAYLVYSPTGAEEPGDFEVLGGGGPGEYFPITPKLDEQVAAVMAPSEKWCTRPKVGCAETADSKGFSFDPRVPLENELADDGDAVESSWKYYLNRAKDAALEADALGENYILANLENDNRIETVEIRQEARQAEAELALSALQTTCGTNVDPQALLALLSTGDPTRAKDLAGMREDITCPATPCSEGFVCMANACIIDIKAFLDKKQADLDPALTEGLHRLQECIGADSDVPYVTPGDQALCVWELGGVPSKVCQLADGDTPFACPVLANGLGNCEACADSSATGCLAVPSGDNHDLYVGRKIEGEDLLGFFNTLKSKPDLSPKNACNYISDALRYQPDGAESDGPTTQSDVNPDVIRDWISKIQASGVFHPIRGSKDVVRRLGFSTSLGTSTTAGAITLDGQTRYTVSKHGGLWWYADDSDALRAVLALKLSMADPADTFETVKMPYYVFGGQGETRTSTTDFLNGDGLLFRQTDSMAFATSRDKDNFGGKRHCDTCWICTTTCWTEHGYPFAKYMTVASEGIVPQQVVGYGSWDGDSDLATRLGDFSMRMAVGTWPKSLLEGVPSSDWWWNGFSSFATAPSELSCSSGEDCTTLSYALLENRNTILARPFNGQTYEKGTTTFDASPSMHSITTTDLLHGAQLLCDAMEYENSFRCDPTNPPAIHGVQDLSIVRAAMTCAADQIEGRSGLLLFPHFPTRARDAMRQESVIGAFPAVGGDIGRKISDLRSSLVEIKQTVSDIGVELKLIGEALDGLRIQESLKDVRDQIVDVQFQQSVTSLISSCLEGIAGTGGVDTFANPGKVGAAAINCANSAIQVDLAGKIQSLQHKENQLALSSALNALRENLATRSGNMQRLKSTLLTQAGTIDGQLADIESLRYEARRQLARALYKASSQAEIEPALTNVYANRASVAGVRYKRAHQRAVELAFLAKRSIEARLGVELSTLVEDYPLVAAPATWEATLCNTSGVDYDKLRKTSADFAEKAQEEFADEFIGTYVQKLEDFVEAYRLQHAFKEGNDTVVASLRDDVLGVRAQCEVPSRNQLNNTDQFAASAVPVGCASDSNCVSATPVLGTEPNVKPFVSNLTELAGGAPFRVQLGSSAGACTAPACGYQLKAGLAQQVSPRETHFPQTYVLSWYHLATETRGKTLFEVLDAETQAVLGGTPVTEDTSRVADWKRSYLKFTLNSARPLLVRVGGKLDATQAGTQFYAAAPMLEATNGPDDGPGSFEGADANGTRLDAACPDTGGKTFRAESFKRDCLKLCSDGFNASCDDSAATQCYREVVFSLNQRDAETGRILGGSGLALGNYNYRIDTIGINLVGTQPQDCSQSESPESCYASANVQYSLIHSGPFIVRNHRGADYEASLFTGRIEHARALASERYITNPMSSTDRELLQSYLRAEFAGRPLDGRYSLRIWETPNLNFDAIEDVQLVVNYRYWTRNR